jgi:hypothetical protein
MGSFFQIVPGASDSILEDPMFFDFEYQYSDVILRANAQIWTKRPEMGFPRGSVAE